MRFAQRRRMQKRLMRRTAALFTLAVAALPAARAFAQEEPDTDRVARGGTTVAPPETTAPSGAAAPDWSVTRDGDLAYRFDIDVPAGRGGVTPQIALTYSSGADAGLAGWGWRLGGFPALVRVPADRGIRYDGNDVVAVTSSLESPGGVEGRLVPVGGGAFHTAVESWNRYTPVGACGDGPCTFEQRGPDGAVFVFGGTADARLWEASPDGVSRGVHAWALSEIRDLFGNRVRLSYEERDGMLYPVRARWGCNDGDDCTGMREVELGYREREHVEASALPLGRVLERISVRAAGVLVREVRLEHVASPDTGRLLVRALRTIGSDGITEAPPVALSYTEAGRGASTTPTRIDAGSGELGARTLVGDVDGDGAFDIVRTSLDRWGGSVLVMRGTDTGPASADKLTLSGYRAGWTSLLADVNGDGRDDLILLGTRPYLRLQWAAGSPDGLLWPPEPLVDGGLDELRRESDLPAHLFRLLALDADGDQIHDIVVVNRQHGSVAFVRGVESGPREVELIEGLGYRNAFAMEPTVIDVEGDGRDDLVLPFADLDEGLGMALLAGTEDGLAAPRSVRWTGDGGLGKPPYQALPGDVLGDGRGDLVVGYTGVRAIGADDRFTRPFERDVRMLLGRGVTAADTAPFASPVVEETLPFSVERERAGAFWQHHLADVDGDRRADLIMHYAGEHGRRVQWAPARADGTFGDVREHHAATHSSPLPDGGVARHKWSSLMADANGDGRADLVMYYAGELGVFVDVVWGTAGGLAPTVDRIVSDPFARVEELGSEVDGSRAASVMLHVADIDGNGRPDIVVGTHDAVYTARAPDGVADLLRDIDNGYGATTTVEYLPVAQAGGAIDSSAPCGARSVCGVADRAPGQLVARVSVNSGRELVSSTGYAYANRRVLPGVPLVRRRMGFEMTTERDYVTGARKVRNYAVTALHAGQLVKEVDYDGASDASMSRRSHTVWAPGTMTVFGTEWVRPVSIATTEYEAGMPVVTSIRLPSFGELGQTLSTRTCAGPKCRIEVTDYEPADMARWVIHRVRGTRTGVDGNVLGVADRAVWDGDVVVATERLLCEDPAACECLDDPDACVAAGTAVWHTVTTFPQHDAYGNVEVAIDARGLRTEYDYDPLFRTQRAVATQFVPASPGGPATIVQTGTSYDEAGRPVVDVDANGNATTIRYDALGRPERLDHPDGGYETWRYVALGDATSQHVAHAQLVDVETHTSCSPAPIAGGAEVCFDTSFDVLRRDYRSFDGVGRVYRVATQTDGGMVVERSEIGVVGGQRVVYESQPAFVDDEATATWTATAMDPRGRPVRVDRLGPDQHTPLAVLERTEYAPEGITRRVNAGDELEDGRIPAPVWQVRREVFDSAGDLERAIDANGSVVHYSYDVLHRPVGTLGPVLAGDSDDAGAQYTLSFLDGWGRPVRVEDSAIGNVDLTWSVAGDLVGRVDEIGRDKRIEFDALGRAHTEQLDGHVVARFTYDDASVPNGVGRLATSWSMEGGDRVRSYDARGQVVSAEIELAGLPGAYEQRWHYDVGGRLRAIDLPDGARISYDVGIGGELRRLEADGFSTEQTSYDAFGHARIRTLADVVETTYSFDIEGRMRSMVTTDGTGVVRDDRRYLYTGTGSVRNVVEDAMGRTWQMHYDYEDRLVSATLHSGKALLHSWKYAYDAAGNLTSRGDMSVVPELRRVRGFRGGAVAFDATFNAAGNMTGKDTTATAWRYSYDGDNRLVLVRRDKKTVVAEYGYDAGGRRVRQTAYTHKGPVTTYYVTPNYEVRESAEEPGRLVATRRITDLDGQVLATTTTDAIYAVSRPPAGDSLPPLAGGTALGLPEGTYLHVADLLGTPVLVTDDAGDSVARYVYEPYGMRLLDESAGTDVTTVGFTGQTHDDTAGLSWYGSRYYDAEIGRFTTADTVTPGDGVDGRGLNRYAYVFGNPTSNVDRDGHCGDRAGGDGELCLQLPSEMEPQLPQHIEYPQLRNPAAELPPIPQRPPAADSPEATRAVIRGWSEAFPPYRPPTEADFWREHAARMATVDQAQMSTDRRTSEEMLRDYVYAQWLDGMSPGARMWADTIELHRMGAFFIPVAVSNIARNYGAEPWERMRYARIAAAIFGPLQEALDPERPTAIAGPY